MMSAAVATTTVMLLAPSRRIVAVLAGLGADFCGAIDSNRTTTATAIDKDGGEVRFSGCARRSSEGKCSTRYGPKQLEIGKA